MKTFDQVLNEGYGYSFDIDFSFLVNALECFGQNDLNDIEVARGALEEAYDDVYGDKPFDSLFKLYQDSQGQITLHVNEIEDRKMLIDVIRDMYENEVGKRLSRRQEETLTNFIMKA